MAMGLEFGTEHPVQVSLQEQQLWTAMGERMRQLRRRAGVHDGMPIQQALDLRIISATELERARWGTGGNTLD